MATIQPRHQSTETAGAWTCRTCNTVNVPGWQVCRACSHGRPPRGAWTRGRLIRPLGFVLLAVAVFALGIFTLDAWAIVVGGGPWLLPAALLWVFVVGASAIIAWQRQS